MVLLLGTGAPALAAPPVIDIPALAAKAAKRYPQKVRVDALLGKDVLRPVEAQPVLGHVEAITKRADGGLDIVIAYGGVLGIGAHPIAVPIEAVALIGPYVAVMDFTPDQLDQFPAVHPPAGTALPSDAVIEVGLTRPFH